MNHKNLHKLLAKQIKKNVGESFLENPQFTALWETINETYQEYETDREILERTMELSSAELEEAFQEIRLARDEIAKEKKKSDDLLLNILPVEVAEELKEKGFTEARYCEEVTVLFADIKGFSTIAKTLTPQNLIAELNLTFSKMDEIIMQHGLERIKTIGDCYMACAGLFHQKRPHFIDAILASLAIQQWMREEKERKNGAFWEVRLGAHTGEAIAGVVGKTKFAYDIWGNTVNIASRMESAGNVGCVNITETIFDMVKDYFVATYRDEIEAKNIGKLKAYFIERLKPEYAQDELGMIPNDKFWEAYNNISC
ncbi:MAG: adenylate/guanylate cyclase domain-containing protein [Bacteroidetes bacterium]|nr:MAG: adenylate/guanylate cyclase domain-containing protein [Bacteroidota bacterium]